MGQFEVEDSNNSNEGTDALDTGCLCLCMLARFHQVAADPQALQHEFGRSGQSFAGLEILRAAKYLKLKAKLVKSGVEHLKDLVLPAIARTKDDNFLSSPVLMRNKVKSLFRNPAARARSPSH